MATKSIINLTPSGVLHENLLGNSEIKVWSQSDANKGISRGCAVDSGSTSPTVGETVTGATSGATGKLIYMASSAGDWGANTGTGTIYMGSCTGRFQDNEDLDGSTSGANFCTVNMPDSATGVDLVQNGDFSVDTDPPPGWTAASSAVLSTEAGGQIGNCLKILEGGANTPTASQHITVEAGKIYRFSFYHKDIDGTSKNPKWFIYDHDNSAYIKNEIIETAAVAWTLVTCTFESPVGCTDIEVGFRHTATNGDATAYYFDETSLWEITPGCTGADALALDGYVKDTTIDIYREHNGSNTQDGSFYAGKFVPTAASDYVRFPGAYYDKEEWYMQFQGRTVTEGRWVKTSTASHAKITITDSAGSTSSSYHTGGGAYEWLEVTRTVDASATSFAVYLYCDAAPALNGDTIVYISSPMLCMGSSIGEGNFLPKANEVILLEKPIPSNSYDGETSQSDIAVTDLNLEADSDSLLPKGCKAVKIFSQVNDSGSAGTDSYIRLRADSTKGYEYYNSCYGLANDTDSRVLAWQQCDSSGDIDINVEASGANTLDIDNLDYVAVKVN